MKTAQVTVNHTDSNGEPISNEFEITYNPDVSEVISEIEYVSASNGGPIMRPKTPRD